MSSSLSDLYVSGPNLTEFFLDQVTGIPVTGGYIQFWEDDNRSIPMPVYQLSGSPPNYTYTELPNPMNITNGYAVDADGNAVAIYYKPFNDDGSVSLYYVVAYSAENVIIETRPGWPNVTAQSSPSQLGATNSNQISNSQFSDVTFNPTYGLTISITGITTDLLYEIAPGWNLKISTSDNSTVVVNRTAIEGALNVLTNPPYVLTILPEGANISSLQLVQRLNHNPDIWATGYIAASAMVESLDDTNHTITCEYAPSTGLPTIIFSGTTGATGFTPLSATVPLDPGSNTDNGDNGYIDIIFALPVTGHIGITSIQVVGLNSNDDNVAYDQETVNRQEDHLFHYYNPLIQAVPVPSISEGWDFKVNPAQFTAAGVVNTWSGASQYIWDQTICWQSADSLVSAQRDAAGRLQLNTTMTGQFALVQYLNMQQMQLLLANGWSTLINAYTDSVTGAAGTVSFYYTTDVSLPVLTTGTNLSLISTIDANGKPLTFHGNWTEMPNPLLGSNQFIIPYNTVNTTSSIALNGWTQPLFGVSSTATFVAIVIGFESLPATNIYFDSIAVTPGMLAIPFAPIDYLSTLKHLGRYYQKSYAYGVAPGTVDINGAVFVTPRYYTNSAGNARASPDNIKLNYDQKVSATPGVNIFSYLIGSAGAFDVVWYVNGIGAIAGSFLYSTYYVTTYTNACSFLAIQNLQNTTISYSSTNIDNATQIFHYTVDSRYGLF